MNNKAFESIYEYTEELRDLHKISNQIKANIAVALLKHKLKSYIAAES